MSYEFMTKNFQYHYSVKILGKVAKKIFTKNCLLRLFFQPWKN